MKKVAVGLAVVLAVVLAFEVPTMLNHGGQLGPGSGGRDDDRRPPPPRPRPRSPTTTPPGTAAAAVTPTASTKLPNSDTQPKVGKSQLYSFSHFADKDPFVQQVCRSHGEPPTPSTAAPARALQPPARRRTARPPR